MYIYVHRAYAEPCEAELNLVDDEIRAENINLNESENGTTTFSGQQSSGTWEVNEQRTDLSAFQNNDWNLDTESHIKRLFQHSESSNRILEIDRYDRWSSSTWSLSWPLLLLFSWIIHFHLGRECGQKLMRSWPTFSKEDFFSSSQVEFGSSWFDHVAE